MPYYIAFVWRLHFSLLFFVSFSYFSSYIDSASLRSIVFRYAAGTFNMPTSYYEWVREREADINWAISPTGGVFSYLPHHLDLASEDSVGHSTCVSVLARRRAIMGSIVQPKRSCLGATMGTAESPHRWGKNHTYPTAKNPPTTPPLTLTLTLTQQPPLIALRRANTLMHVL